MRSFYAFMAKRVLAATAVIAFAVVALVSGASASEPDAIFFNGKIVTLDAAGTTVSGVAVKDGKILKVGAADEIKKLAGAATRLVDLSGKTVVPGFIDAHCHPMETIMMKDGWVDARYPACPSVKQALANIAAWIKNTPKEKWVFVACVSASENKFAEKRLPTKGRARLRGAGQPGDSCRRSSPGRCELHGPEKARRHKGRKPL